MAPYVLDIQNVTFKNMQSDFVVGQPSQMFLMSKFNLRNVIFDKDILFANVNQCTIKGYKAHNEYLVATDIQARNIKVAKHDNSYESQINLKNAKYSGLTVAESGTGVGLANVSYCLDVLVKDAKGNPVPGAVIKIENEVDPKILPMNLNVSQKWSPHGSNGSFERNYYKNDVLTSTVTGPDGHTPLPSDPVNTIVLLGSCKRALNQQSMAYTITAEKGGLTGNAKGVKPDESWYRSDPKVPTKTVVIILEEKK
ncbi:MAG: hypothetical protein KKG09_10935, partial [Verrucomicrobia bacterium]|nr:hypothetical protein [Verrucomicrobiota bacterium]MBU4291303.1 hypothetical protein [Verrucomicrobiota bacterium]MBU4498507.1 hypothetical protein [Verrucomicrobiota bacterium]MCG2678669.1 hypothetical protein [Kiritimatiellia bacterium]